MFFLEFIMTTTDIAHHHYHSNIVFEYKYYSDVKLRTSEENIFLSLYHSLIVMYCDVAIANPRWRIKVHGIPPQFYVYGKGPMHKSMYIRVSTCVR